MKRSNNPEILDGRDYTRKELFKNLRELYMVNRWLGGHANSAALFRQCLATGFAPEAVVDIGCGGGDTLEMLEKKFSSQLSNCQWIGCDLNIWCLQYANEHHKGKKLDFRESDFQEVRLSGRVVYHAALFFHHFTEEEIVRFLSYTSSQGAAVIINDLHRHPLAWLSIRLISSLPGIGRLFRNDAPLSVKRAFTRKEWEQILHKSGIKSYRIRWAWAFRYLICITPENP